MSCVVALEDGRRFGSAVVGRRRPEVGGPTRNEHVGYIHIGVYIERGESAIAPWAAESCVCRFARGVFAPLVLALAVRALFLAFDTYTLLLDIHMDILHIVLSLNESHTRAGKPVPGSRIYRRQ